MLDEACYFLFIAPKNSALFLNPFSLSIINSAAAKSSGKVSEEDKRHLCLALSPIKNPENRFLHKDHSNYYCTLILNRDSQAYCYAVVTGDPKQCNNIVSSELEKECLEKAK